MLPSKATPRLKSNHSQCNVHLPSHQQSTLPTLLLNIYTRAVLQNQNMSLVLCPCCCKPNFPIFENNVNISISDKKQFRHKLLLCHLCCNFCQLNHSTRLPRIYSTQWHRHKSSFLSLSSQWSVLYATEDIIVDFNPVRNTKETNTNIT